MLLHQPQHLRDPQHNHAPSCLRRVFSLIAEPHTYPPCLHLDMGFVHHLFFSSVLATSWKVSWNPSRQTFASEHFSDRGSTNQQAQRTEL